ncbi:MAG: CCA tRNA nucleotidyltransferase [Simkaniaceae bacterium]|nr:CCA tRNA nucleotidyltransferase [Simkaniaceae bacterium]
MDHLSAGKHVVSILQEAGHTAYFAGGWVRDFLMEHPSDDIDIATSASTDEISSLFPKTIPVGVNYGIIIVVLSGHSFEVATFRKDRGYVDGRRPTGVDPAPPEEDAKRRDFTINGMFYDPLKGVLYDYIEGEKDLKNQLIRAIGNPHERFLEDRLRMIRAIRYASRFHFSIHQDTMQAIDTHAATLFPSVAIERVVHEFEKMHRFANFDEALIRLHQHFLLPTIFPSLKGVTLEEIKARVHLIPLFPKDIPLILKLLELFPKDSRENHLQLCERLKLSNKEKEWVLFFHKVLLTPFEADDYTWAHLYAHPLFPLLFQFLSLKQSMLPHVQRKEILSPFIARIEAGTPLINAEQLIAHGMKPGKELGKTLQEMERYAINHRLTDPNELLRLHPFDLQ